VSVNTLLLIVIVTFAFGFVLGLLLAAIREQYNQLHAIHDALGARSIRDKPAEMRAHEALRSRTRHGEASGMPSR
jgi:hypothetical protein